MHNFKGIIAWQKARVLVKEIYLLTRKFPREEVFELASQIRRAVISIPSNIAEGSGRSSGKEFNRFLDIAISSAFELETQIILSFDLGYISEGEMEQIGSKISEVQKVIFGFQKSINN